MKSTKQFSHLQSKSHSNLNSNSNSNSNVNDENVKFSSKSNIINSDGIESSSRRIALSDLPTNESNINHTRNNVNFKNSVSKNTYKSKDHQKILNHIERLDKKSKPDNHSDIIDSSSINNPSLNQHSDDILIRSHFDRLHDVNINSSLRDSHSDEFIEPQDLEDQEEEEEEDANKQWVDIEDDEYDDDDDDEDEDDVEDDQYEEDKENHHNIQSMIRKQIQLDHGILDLDDNLEKVTEEEELEEEELEEEEEEEEEEEDEHNYNKPMEPKWNASIYKELKHVMELFSRNELDENDEDTYDVTMVAEYAPEIFNYMHELEHKLAPSPTYMDNQDELKWEMRSVLIDWVVQVHSRFNLLPETLFLTVNYIDRFLSKRKVSLSRFQLVGAVALFIAAKYEEINCPTVQEVAYMADNAYSVDDFLKAERFMIDVLEFDMGWPGPMSFLRRTSKADDYDYETRTLAKYFLEITIMDARFVASQPSWLAAGSHYLSRRLLNKGHWTESHVFYSGYTESQLRPVAEIILENCRNAETNHRAIFEKYQERRYRRSSTFVQEYFQAIE